MRELKFRALMKKEFGGKWIYWTIDRPFRVESLRMETTCQFIGLKDKGKKEIYEGDIVRFWSNDSISVVKWNSEYGCFDLKGGHMNRLDLEKSEVIGDIYENNKEL